MLMVLLMHVLKHVECVREGEKYISTHFIICENFALSLQYPFFILLFAVHV